VMAEDSGQTVLAGLEPHILPLVDGLGDRLQQGISVLDIGCGKGRAMLQLASHYPNSHFTGIDLSEEAIGLARQQAETAGLTNLQFAIGDLSEFNRTACTEHYDLVTSFDSIHDQAKPQNVLDGIFKTLKPGGTYLMQDIRASSQLEKNLEHPIGPLLYTLSCMHCMTVSLAQEGAGLGTMWGEELALEMLQCAGFEQPQVHQLEHDFQNNFYVMTK
ncbi:MAG: class I SAM-dependent methyltransferase, partial [Halopseudomonas sp.]